MDAVLDRNKDMDSFLNNRVELDIALEKMARDPLRDNDDYQLLIEDSKAKPQSLAYVSYF